MAGSDARPPAPDGEQQSREVIELLRRWKRIEKTRLLADLHQAFTPPDTILARHPDLIRAV